jgi:hypothetical protein
LIDVNYQANKPQHERTMQLEQPFSDAARASLLEPIYQPTIENSLVQKRR